MTRRQLQQRVEYWRSRLAPEWTIFLKESGPPDHDEENYSATSQTDDDYLNQRLHFTDACLRDGDRGDPVDKVIIHELLHALFRSMRRLQDTARPHMPPAVWDHYHADAEHEEEQLVERLARSILAGDGGRPPFRTIPDAEEA